MPQGGNTPQIAIEELTHRHGWGIRTEDEPRWIKPASNGLIPQGTKTQGSLNVMTLPRRNRMTRLHGACTALAAVLALSGCAVFSPTPIPRGSLVEADDYNQLIPGSSTRADALDLMGTPTTKGAFDDNTWIYISMTTRLVPMDYPAVIKQDVVVLKFTPSGTLQSVRALDRKDAIHVAMVSKITPTPGTKVNILQQILGNVGRYNPMQNMMGSGSAGGMMGGYNNQGPGHFGSGNSL